MEENLDQIALSIERSVKPASVVLEGGVVADDRLHAMCADDAVGIVGRVGDERSSLSMWQQLFGHRRIVLLSWRQRDLQWPRLRIDNGMDLR